MESTFLRKCLSLPKLAAPLRTCNPVSLIDPYKSFDSLFLSSLSDCLGACLSPWSWSLPVSMGGLGLRKASVHSSSAYYAALYNSSDTIVDILGSTPDRLNNRLFKSQVSYKRSYI